MIASAYKSDKKNPFVTLADHEYLEKYRVKSFEVQGKSLENCSPREMLKKEIVNIFPACTSLIVSNFFTCVAFSDLALSKL